MNNSSTFSSGWATVARRYLGPLLLAISFLLLAHQGWRKWIDIQVDYGRLVYIYWQMSLGKVLYRDIAWMHGPLAEYINMTLFSLLGSSITVLMVANLGLIALLTTLVYRYFLPITDRLTATVIGLALLQIFCLGQYDPTSCFNFVAPYNYDLTWGVVLSVGVLYCLSRHNVTKQRHWLLVAGVCWGAVFLTKAETMLAISGAVLAYPLLRRLTNQWGTKETLQTLGYLLAAALLPMMAFGGYFLTKMPAMVALKGILGNWYYLMGRRPLQDPFYQLVLGTDKLAFNIGRALLLLGLGLLALAVVTGIDYALRRVKLSPIIYVGFSIATALVVYLLADIWVEVGRPLNFLLPICLVFLLQQVWQQRHNPEKLTPLIPLLLWGIWGLLLLAKIFWHVQLKFYGFALALPAGLFIVAFLLHYFPAYLQNRYQGGQRAQAMLLGFILLMIASYSVVSNKVYQTKSFPLGKNGDQVLNFDEYIDVRSSLMAQTLNFLDERLPPQATLLVLPEGAFFNYWLRRTNPTPYSAFTPYDFYTYGGEVPVLAALQRTPPDFILIVHRDTLEYGTGYFGTDPQYGQLIMSWVWENYEQEIRFGAQPHTSTVFGIALLRRKSVSSSSPALLGPK